MSYTELFYNNIVSSIITSRLTFDPNFNCPNCKTLNTRLNDKPTFNYQASKVYNYNQLVTVTLPCCGAQIRLFIAVHKDIGGVPRIRLQKSSSEGAAGIPANWYLQPVKAV